ncbi:MAG: 2TM domain-containing protein [Methanobrevibacter sp.]|nr:2TM domain-containing protein [Methanobrevibacter sp.]
MNDYERAAERVDRKLKFYRSLISYIIVNAFLFAINYIFTPSFWWVMFPIFFWGIGLVVNFFKTFVFIDFYGEEYRQRKIAEEMEKMKV